MTKKDEIIIQQKRGRRQSRVQPTEDGVNGIKELKSLRDELNIDKTATDNMSEAVLGSVGNRPQRKSTAQDSKDDDEGEAVSENPAVKTLSFVLKVLVVVILVIAIVTFFVIYRQNKATEARYAKIEEYTRYIDSYFQVMNEGNIDMYKGYFNSDTKIAEEYEYFQDGVYADNAKALLNSLLATVSVQYNTTSNGMKDVSESSNVMLSYLDYNELKQVIYDDAKGIKLEVKELKTGTPKDRQIIKNFILSNLSEHLSEFTTRVQESANIGIVNVEDKKSEARYLDGSIDERVYETVLKTKELEEVFNLYYDIIKGDIKDEEDYEGYKERVDKKYFSGKKTRNPFVESYIFDVDYKAENGISKLVGEGTLESPASIGTEVESVYKARVKTKKGKYKTKKCKVLVSIDKAYIGEDAIAYANSLDTRNRGLSTDLTGTLMILDVSIKNLTKSKFTVSSNFGAVDEYGNLYYSTGQVYGMKSTAKLKKYGTAKMQYYILCDTLDTKTAIYGADFNKKIPYVYFNAIQEYVSKSEEQ